MSNSRPWREGVATRRSRHDGLWWIGVYLVMAVVQSVYEDGAQRWVVGVCWLAALATGAAWQVRDRRDPADRLVFIAFITAIVGVMMVLPLGGGGDLVRADAAHLVPVLPLVAGVLLAEQWLRSRDARPRTPRSEGVGAAD